MTPDILKKIVSAAKKRRIWRNNQKLNLPWSQYLQIDKQAGRWKVTQLPGRKEINTHTLFKSAIWFDFFPHGPLFSPLLASSFLMSVFILHVTVWHRAPSYRYLYTSVHIREPTPSVLLLFCSPVSQTLSETASIQFEKHLKWYVANVEQFPLSKMVFSSLLTPTLLSLMSFKNFSF